MQILLCCDYKQISTTHLNTRAIFNCVKKIRKNYRFKMDADYHPEENGHSGILGIKSKKGKKKNKLTLALERQKPVFDPGNGYTIAQLEGEHSNTKTPFV